MPQRGVPVERPRRTARTRRCGARSPRGWTAAARPARRPRRRRRPRRSRSRSASLCVARAAAQRRGDAGDADAGAELEHALAADSLVLRRATGSFLRRRPSGVAEAGGAEGELAQRNRARRRLKTRRCSASVSTTARAAAAVRRARITASSPPSFCCSSTAWIAATSTCARRARGGEQPEILSFIRILAQAAATRDNRHHDSPPTGKTSQPCVFTAAQVRNPLRTAHTRAASHALRRRLRQARQPRARGGVEARLKVASVSRGGAPAWASSSETRRRRLWLRARACRSRRTRRARSRAATRWSRASARSPTSRTTGCAARTARRTCGSSRRRRARGRPPLWLRERRVHRAGRPPAARGGYYAGKRDAESAVAARFGTRRLHRAPARRLRRAARRQRDARARRRLHADASPSRRRPSVRSPARSARSVRCSRRPSGVDTSASPRSRLSSTAARGRRRRRRWRRRRRTLSSSARRARSRRRRRARAPSRARAASRSRDGARARCASAACLQSSPSIAPAPSTGSRRPRRPVGARAVRRDVRAGDGADSRRREDAGGRRAAAQRRRRLRRVPAPAGLVRLPPLLAAAPGALPAAEGGVKVWARAAAHHRARARRCSARPVQDADAPRRVQSGIKLRHSVSYGRLPSRDHAQPPAPPAAAGGSTIAVRWFPAAATESSFRRRRGRARGGASAHRVVRFLHIGNH